MSDAPAIEPLPPALEEAARSIAHEWMERLGYAKGIPAQAQRWLDAGEHEDFDAVYDLKKTLRFVRFVLERVPRDEAAELREENHTLRTEADGWLKRVELLEAAIREWVEATSDAEMFELDQSNAYGTDHADAEYRVEAAAQALRRLAGGGES